MAVGMTMMLRLVMRMAAVVMRYRWLDSWMEGAVGRRPEACAYVCACVRV